MGGWKPEDAFHVAEHVSDCAFSVTSVFSLNSSFLQSDVYSTFYLSTYCVFICIVCSDGNVNFLRIRTFYFCILFGGAFIEVKTQHACIINLVNFKMYLAAPSLPCGMQDHLVTA